VRNPPSGSVRTLLAAALTTAAALAAFGPWASGPPAAALFALLAIVLLSALLRLGPGGGTACAVLAAGAAVGGTLAGNGPFAGGDPPLSSSLAGASVLALAAGAAALRRAPASPPPARGTEAGSDLLRGVVEGTSDAVFVKDVKGRYLLINQAGARILGKSVEEVLGGEDSSIYAEETSRQIQKGDLDVLLSGEPSTVEEIRSIGGASRAYSVTRAPYRDVRGRIAGIIGIARDITERREAEAIVRRQTEALTRALKRVAAEPSLDSLGQQVVREIGRELNASFVSLFVRDAEAGDAEASAIDETARITERIREGDPLTARPASIDDRDPAWQRLVQTRAPLVVDRVAENPLVGEEARFWAGYHGLQTLLVVPLLWGNEVLGTVSVFSRERRAFRPEEQELAQALGHLAMLALQLARMAREREASALVEERNRLAREIHDTLAQGFTGIIFQLEAALEVLEEDRPSGAAHVERALGVARENLAEARRSVAELRPRILEHGGLGRALHELVGRSTRNGLPRLELAVHGASRPLPPSVEDNLLKIAQEAVTNSLKHARARTIRVELSYGDRETSLTVRDDGRGFSPSEPGPRGGYGLLLMRERADGFEGRFDLTSRPGGGTRVSVTVPDARA